MRAFSRAGRPAGLPTGPRRAGPDPLVAPVRGRRPSAKQRVTPPGSERAGMREMPGATCRSTDAGTDAGPTAAPLGRASVARSRRVRLGRVRNPPGRRRRAVCFSKHSGGMHPAVRGYLYLKSTMSGSHRSLEVAEPDVTPSGPDCLAGLGSRPARGPAAQEYEGQGKGTAGYPVRSLRL